jgi:hypothetical protein
MSFPIFIAYGDRVRMVAKPETYEGLMDLCYEEFKVASYSRNGNGIVTEAYIIHGCPIAPEKKVEAELDPTAYPFLGEGAYIILKLVENPHKNDGPLALGLDGDRADEAEDWGDVGGDGNNGRGNRGSKAGNWGDGDGDGAGEGENWGDNDAYSNDPGETWAVPLKSSQSPVLSILSNESHLGDWGAVTNTTSWSDKTAKPSESVKMDSKGDKEMPPGHDNQVDGALRGQASTSTLTGAPLVPAPQPFVFPDPMSWQTMPSANMLLSHVRNDHAERKVLIPSVAPSNSTRFNSYPAYLPYSSDDARSYRYLGPGNPVQYTRLPPAHPGLVVPSNSLPQASSNHHVQLPHQGSWNSQVNRTPMGSYPQGHMGSVNNGNFAPVNQNAGSAPVSRPDSSQFSWNTW